MSWIESSSFTSNNQSPSTPIHSSIPTKELLSSGSSSSVDNTQNDTPNCTGNISSTPIQGSPFTTFNKENTNQGLN